MLHKPSQSVRLAIQWVSFAVSVDSPVVSIVPIVSDVVVEIGTKLGKIECNVVGFLIDVLVL